MIKRILVSTMLGIGVITFSGCASSFDNAGYVETMSLKTGEVVKIDTVKVKDNGVGTVIGAVVGGLVGHNFGKGKGNVAMTATGAVAGGVIGNKLNEKTVKRITVKFADNTSVALHVPLNYPVTLGEKIKVEFVNGKPKRLVKER